LGRAGRVVAVGPVRLTGAPVWRGGADNKSGAVGDHGDCGTARAIAAGEDVDSAVKVVGRHRYAAGDLGRIEAFRSPERTAKFAQGTRAGRLGTAAPAGGGPAQGDLARYEELLNG
jgi:hypothetical protein